MVTMGPPVASPIPKWDYSRVKFACWGDSLTDGYAAAFAAAYNPPRQVYNGGVGGETTTQELARMVASTLYRGRVTIIWDRITTGEASATWLANIASMVALAASGKFVVVSDINKTDGTEDVGSEFRTAMIARNAALASAYGANFLDVVDDLDDDTLRTDGLHLTTTARDTVFIPALKQKLVDLGYMNVTS